MRITRLESHLLRLPLPYPATARDDRRPPLTHVFALVVRLHTDTDSCGLGFAYAEQGGGRALQAIADDDLAPLIVGEDPLDHERLGQRVSGRFQGIGRSGLVPQAYSAVDVALWDLKGKAAGLPLYKLLGGARSAAPVYAGDAGWLWLSPEQIIERAQDYLSQGIMGIKMKIGLPDPEADAGRLQRVRDVLGEDVWFAVDANQRYDYSTALAMGRFLDEEIAPDWLEEPISCDDIDGHARLADKLETPIAIGESLYNRLEFEGYIEQRAATILQPDVTRVGGVTAWLKIAALAEAKHRPVTPHVLPEIGVHLACGLPGVVAVEYMPWLFPLFTAPPKIVDGKLVPPAGPGLGLELNPDTLGKYAWPVAV